MGRIGYIDSWVEDEKEDSAFDHEKRLLRYVPRVVLVQYYEWVWDEGQERHVEQPCKWTVPGIDRPGVYPVFPWKRPWHLDQQRKVPRLEVKRYQIPLAPAYAMTAHSSQGRTLPAAIIDLQIGRGVSSIASYVAMTRAGHNTDILIFSFQQRRLQPRPSRRTHVVIKTSTSRTNRLERDRRTIDAKENMPRPLRLA